MDAFEPGEIEHQAAVAQGRSGDVVPSGTDRQEQSLVPGQADCGDDVGDPAAAGDEAGALVDHAVPDAPRRRVAGVGGRQQFAAEVRAQTIDGPLAEAAGGRLRHAGGCRVNEVHGRLLPVAGDPQFVIALSPVSNRGGEPASPIFELAMGPPQDLNGGMSKGYGQFCPVAKASEVFANRWTPLILRELLAGMHAFNDIRRGVPLVSTAVLVTRLRELEDRGIVERRPRAGGTEHDYWLTPAGEAFGPVVSALNHWGLVHGRDRITPGDLDPTVLLWAWRRRVGRAALPDRRVVVQFEFSGVPANRTRFRTLWLVLERSDVEVCIKNPGFPVDAVFRGDIGQFVAAYLGHVGWRELLGRSLSIDPPEMADRLCRWLRIGNAGVRDPGAEPSPMYGIATNRD